MQLYEMTVRELQTLLNNRQISVAEITDSVFGRINDVEEQVKAFITVNEAEARWQAAQQDQSGTSGALHGIPMGLKDLFCTKGVKTTCASKMLADFVPFYNATCVERLLASGSILAGKLNMDEMAVGTSTEQSAFFPTHNPWDLSKVPGGSSGGSAAAVAADEVPFALGTDTGGSVRQPASFCGVVGLKPTYGRVSRYGVNGFASSLDHIGTLTKDVADAALILQVIAGQDPLDSTSAALDVPDYTAALSAAIKGLKLGYPKEYFQPGVSPAVKEQIMAALKIYEALGAHVEEVSLPYSEYALAAYYILAPAEGSTNLARFDGVRYGLRDFTAENIVDMFADSREQGLGEEVKKRIILGTYFLSAGYYEAYYIKAMQVRRKIREDFQRVFSQVDILVGPTTTDTAFALGELSEDPMARYLNDLLTVPANMAGLPSISLPAGFVQGLPVGLQLIGQPFAESKLLNAAYAFEQQTDFHKQKPRLGRN